MPRQLPWKSSGGGSRTQTVKPSSRPSKTSRIPDDIDDDFLDGTVLASNKGKSKVKATSDSEVSLPNLPAEPSTPRTRTGARAPSSSPPPLVDYAAPHIEPMRKCVSKFDLQDDEWMMVEDEFLETAKLFTRHLHIAEYDRLKESIEAKKKEAEVVRPVVAGAKRSAEGAAAEKAKVQISKQRKAIRDVLASPADESEDDRASHRLKPSRAAVKISKPRPDTDSDDLDAPRAPKPRSAPIPAAIKPSPTSSRIPNPTPSFAKPALPALAASGRPRVRASRMTPFDMLDDYTPPKSNPISEPTHSPQATDPSAPNKVRSQSASSTHSSPQPSQTPMKKPIKSRRSLDFLDDWGPGESSSGISKEVADRFAKRKAEREKDRNTASKKSKATSLDDIPTFMF